MQFGQRQTLGFRLILGGMLALGTACGGDGDDQDGGVDAGPADTGTADSGDTLPDSGPPRDAGVRDASPQGDAGHYCAAENRVNVEGERVPVAPASTVPEPSAGPRATLNCIDRPPTEHPAWEYCITECLSFLGETPSADQVESLEIAVFLSEVGGRPVDPSFDPATYLDRTPSARAPVGGTVTAVAPNTCASGWQVELAYLDLGAETMASGTYYTVRVRTSSAAPEAWPTTYHHRFVRRNDQVPSLSVCGSKEQRIPGREFVFPVVPASYLQRAVAQAGRAIPGSDNLRDGRGTGYAMFEVRDCSGASGVSISRATAGTLPAPLAELYPAVDFGVARTEAETSLSGLYMAVGFTGTSSASTQALPVVGAVGLTTDGTCTEEFGGTELLTFPDSVTYVRFNRETVLHGRR